jgi:serine/threonine protein kinase
MARNTTEKSRKACVADPIPFRLHDEGQPRIYSVADLVNLGYDRIGFQAQSQVHEQRLMVVKLHKPYHSVTSERHLARNAMANFCLTSTLDHGNIAQTLDLFRDGSEWHSICESYPYNLYDVVQTGRMSREEIACCFRQILEGLNYIHSMGIAHRDLKLEKILVSDDGIMKISGMEFCHVFRTPLNDEVFLATGECLPRHKWRFLREG